MNTIGENPDQSNRNDICRRLRTAGAADHTNASNQNLLAVKEAALVLGLAVSTLNKHRVYGTGPRFVKLGRSVRYRPADLDAWIDANRRASTSEESGCGSDLRCGLNQVKLRGTCDGVAFVTAVEVNGIGKACR